MTATAAPEKTLDGPLEAEESTGLKVAWGTVLSRAEGRIGLTLGALMVTLVVVGPWVAPYPPNKLLTGLPLTGPSFHHLLGTDQLGRDVFSRWLNGGRPVLGIPLLSITLAVLFGGALGMLGAYRGGWVDMSIGRFFDLLLALPSLLVVLVLISVLGTSPTTVVCVVAIVFMPRVGRVFRGAAQGIIAEDYIAAAQARGESTTRMLVREILPNMAAIAIANYALFLTYGIIFIATLSFLGLGAQPPSSEWGLMVASSIGFVQTNPWAAVAPAVGIAAFSIAFILTGDAITRHLSRDLDSAVVKF